MVCFAYTFLRRVRFSHFFVWCKNCVVFTLMFVLLWSNSLVTIKGS